MKSGLGSMDGAGALVVFATSAGGTAKDNGIFAQQLAAALPRPGVSLDDALKSAAREVIRLTNRAQIPAIYGLLEEDVMLVAGSAPAPARSEPRQQFAPAGDPKPEATVVTIPEPPRTSRITFGSRFVIAFSPEVWSTGDAGAGESNERVQFNKFDSGLSAIMTAETVQKGITFLKEDAIATLGGAVRVDEDFTLLKSPRGFYRLMLSKGTDRYLYYLYSGEAGTMRAVVYGAQSDPGWASGTAKYLLDGISLVAVHP